MPAGLYIVAGCRTVAPVFNRCDFEEGPHPDPTGTRGRGPLRPGAPGDALWHRFSTGGILRHRPNSRSTAGGDAGRYIGGVGRCRCVASLVRWFAMAVVFAIAASGVAVAGSADEQAVVTLRDGTVMRAPFTRSEGEIVLHTPCGDVHLPMDEIDKLDIVTVAATQPAPASRPTPTPARSPSTATTQPAGQPHQPAATRPTREPPPEPPGALPPPALLSPADVLRIKLAELPVEGPPERVSVRFLDKPGEPSLIELVQAEWAAAGGPPAQADRLTRGRPYEKLQVILRATGLEYAERIELHGEPATFTDFRRKIVPLVVKGCARSGCHAGPQAAVFRFPDVPRSSGPAAARRREAYIYTLFVVLDRTRAPTGPLIDRESPADSVLVQYMLGSTEAVVRHPPLVRGRVSPVLRNSRDRNYQVLVDWISRLRTPHPDYQLQTPQPAWLGPPAEK